MRHLVFFLLLFSSGINHAQITIQGTVKDSSGKALIGANIIARKPHGNKILAYAISQSQGEYNLQIKKQSEALEISVSFFGYQTQKIIKEANSQKIDFILSVSHEELEEVIIKTPPINLKGDTINYKVSALKRPEDKSLVDVLKRIPGIEVKTNGIIYYDGKAINKFYIENMDMLNGRYNLASNNLPVEGIASVQVYENHQPIRVLDSLVYSDRAALNIRLKKSFTYTVPFELGTGYRPVLWQTKFVPMLFKHKMQSLALLQYNNTGKKLNNQISSFYPKSDYEVDIFNDYHWISVSGLSPPPFEEDKWLNNTSYLVSINYLRKLSPISQITTNLSYLPENIDEKGYNKQQILLDNQLITIIENQTHKQKNRYADFNMGYEKNSKKNYLHYSLNFKYRKANDKSFISNKNINQKVYRPSYSINNKLKWLFPVSKQLYRIDANVNYESKREYYLVKPGSFSNIFNQGTTYEFLDQNINEKKLYFDISTGFIKKWKRFTLEDRIKLTSNFNWLETGFYTSETNHFENTAFQNQTQSHKSVITNQFSVNYRNDSWSFHLDLPLRYVDYVIHDTNLKPDKSVHNFILDYDAGLLYKINSYSFYLSQSHEVKYNTLFHNHLGYILKSYNRLERFNAPIQKETLMRYFFSVKYKDVLNGFNIKLNLSYKNILSNIIYQIQYSPEGLSQQDAISKINHSKIGMAQLFIHKYFLKSKIQTKFNFMYEVSQKPLFLNNQFNNKRLKTFRFMSLFGFPLHKNISMYLDFESSSYLFEDANNNINSYNLKNEFFWRPFKNHQINLSVDYYLTPKEQLKDYFINLSYKFSPKKKKWSVYVKWFNITSLDTYTSYFSDATFSFKNVYFLRPSYVLIGFEGSL